METHKLAEAIKKRAEKRFDDELLDLLEFIGNHPIGRKLKVRIMDKRDNGEEEELFVSIVNWNSNVYDTLVNASKGTFDVHRNGRKASNLDTLKKEFVERYEHEEIAKIFKQLDLLKDILNEADA